MTYLTRFLDARFIVRGLYIAVYLMIVADTSRADSAFDRALTADA